ncbi:LOW QUALITY PROTEIN: methenyltetrahydrofolate synthase domain-containing protein [Rhynchocyon petersi]
MESQNLADFPRPVHHRIPNFKGSYRACENIRKLDAFAGAQEVKVDPDKPLEGVRLLALQSHKTLLVPTPRLRTGLFNRIVPPPGATKDVLRKCATSQGVRNYSVPVGLDSKVLVDLVIVGSVAVSEQGWRIGKGEGYADLEYAMMVAMGAVHQETPVVTIVHDCQVVDIPEVLLGDHDLTVDYVLTPTRVIQTGCRRPKPSGVLWSQVSAEMLEKIPVLRSLRQREQPPGDPGSHLYKDSHDPTSSESRDPRPQDTPQPTGRSVPIPHSARHRQEPRPHATAPPIATVHVGDLPAGARVSELKQALRERGAAPLRLTWQGSRHPAILSYRDLATANQAVTALQGLRLGTSTLRVQLLGRQQRSELVASYEITGQAQCGKDALVLSWTPRTEELLVRTHSDTPPNPDTAQLVQDCHLPRGRLPLLFSLEELLREDTSGENSLDGAGALPIDAHIPGAFLLPVLRSQTGVWGRALDSPESPQQQKSTHPRGALGFGVFLHSAHDGGDPPGQIARRISGHITPVSGPPGLAPGFTTKVELADTLARPWAKYPELPETRKGMLQRQGALPQVWRGDTSQKVWATPPTLGCIPAQVLLAASNPAGRERARVVRTREQEGSSANEQHVGPQVCGAKSHAKQGRTEASVRQGLYEQATGLATRCRSRVAAG